MIRYTTRGAVSLERLTQDTNGDLVYTFTHPWADVTTSIRLSPLELLEKLAALVALPRVHLGRYGGCGAPHSPLRGAIIPTPRQQGVEDEEATDTASPCWSWARLLKRVFALAMATCPLCRQGALRLIAASTQAEVIHTMLRPLKRAADPPPLAPARSRQAAFDWVTSCPQRRVWSCRRRVRSGGVSHPSRVCNPVDIAPQPATTPVRRPAPVATPAALP